MISELEIELLRILRDEGGAEALRDLLAVIREDKEFLPGLRALLKREKWGKPLKEGEIPDKVKQALLAARQYVNATYFSSYRQEDAARVHKLIDEAIKENP